MRQDPAAPEAVDRARENLRGIPRAQDAGWIGGPGTEMAILNTNPESPTRNQVQRLPIVFVYELKNGLDAYLADWAKGTSMKTLADIVAFNQANAEKALRFGQDIFLAAESTRDLPMPSCVIRICRLRSFGRTFPPCASTSRPIPAAASSYATTPPTPPTRETRTDAFFSACCPRSPKSGVHICHA